MANVLIAAALVLAIIYIVPFLVYGLASAVAGLKPPEGTSPGRFLLSVLVTKVGTATAFVLIFYLGRSSLSGQWVQYAVVWWIMLVVGEVGQAIGPNYSWKEAIAGAVSETIYVPLSGYVTNWLVGTLWPSSLTTRWSRPGQPRFAVSCDTSLGLAGRLISRPFASRIERWKPRESFSTAIQKGAPQ